MADTGFVIAGAGADEAYTGSDQEWADPENITADDNSYALAVLDNSGDESNYLKVSGWDLSAVPTKSTIDGVEVRIQKRSRAPGEDVQDQRLRLRKGDVGAESDDKADTGTNWPDGATNVDVGGATDLWGYTGGTALVPADLATLQVLLSIGLAAGSDEGGRVDAVWIKIYYTRAPAHSRGGYVI